MADQISKVDLLNSWKEIATYLGRGVRTVQRWEKNGLPVRRVGNGPRAPVIASVRDIDAWTRSAQAHGFTLHQSSEQLVFRGGLNETVEQARLLREEMIRLRASHHEHVVALVENIKELERACGLGSTPASSKRSYEARANIGPKRLAQSQLRRTAIAV